MSKTDKIIHTSSEEISEKVTGLCNEFIHQAEELKALLSENNRLLGEILKKLDKE